MLDLSQILLPIQVKTPNRILKVEVNTLSETVQPPETDSQTVSQDEIKESEQWAIESLGTLLVESRESSELMTFARKYNLGRAILGHVFSKMVEKKED